MEMPIFLRAEWRYLAMLNYVVDADLLEPFVPAGTELDYYNGETFVSVVGFRFLNTRVFGIPFPFYINFEEVNLRFYVRRKVSGEWRRGVVFIREIVPRRAIAWIARAFYGEPYSSFPMRHCIEHTAENLQVEYAWQRSGKWESLSAKAVGQVQAISVGSEEAFIAEHYWGYTATTSGTNEYQVEHPRWRIWKAEDAMLDADIATLYGPRFVSVLAGPVVSAFIAEGSEISVAYKTKNIS
ncbi:MAG: YqjF family protein [Chthoniobacterales bacterium]